jgi:putative oxidoreductase
MNKTLHYLIRPMSHGRYADFGLLLLRFGPGCIMAKVHGWGKVMHYSEYSEDFYNFLGLGSAFSFGLIIFAEFVCSLLIVLGFFTRLATMPLIIAMLVIIFDVNSGKSINSFETPLLFMMIFVVLLITGAGKYSLDYKLFAKNNVNLA